MEQSKQQQIRELTDRLNRCRYEYYNLNAPSLTDAEYDALFDELSALEKETGFNLTNSPTQTVGCYPAVSTLEKRRIRSRCCPWIRPRAVRNCCVSRENRWSC